MLITSFDLTKFIKLFTSFVKHSKIFKTMTTLYLLVFIIFTHLNSSLSQKITNETEAQLFLKDVDKKLGEMKSKVIFTQWNFNTDINDENENRVVSLQRKTLTI